MCKRAGSLYYGPNVPEMYRRAAAFVDRILKGAIPGRASGRAAHAFRSSHQSQDSQGLGLEVPPTLLARADEVIE